MQFGLWIIVNFTIYVGFTKAPRITPNNPSVHLKRWVVNRWNNYSMRAIFLEFQLLPKYYEFF